jgi:hypothetical protein
MKRIAAGLVVTAVIALGLAGAGLADHGCTSCTDAGPCARCVPACSGTWDDKKSPGKPTYSMKCEYACVRGREPWHVPPPECRCHPPCGDIIVKKKVFKVPGPEKEERVPKYEVRMVPEPPCDCDHGCRHEGLCWWNPLTVFARLKPW